MHLERILEEEYDPKLCTPTEKPGKRNSVRVWCLVREKGSCPVREKGSEEGQDRNSEGLPFKVGIVNHYVGKEGHLAVRLP